MNLLHYASPFPTVRFIRTHHHHRSRSTTTTTSPLSRPRLFAVRASLPFPIQEAKYYRELEAAVDVVERACHLCVDVKSSLFSSDGRIVEKNDQTPVTVADFGVQGLVSLELGKLFPSIPLVAEEDSAFVRSNNLEDPVVKALTHQASAEDKPWTHDDVLRAIDRGGKEAFTFRTKPATYWVLDPIDGTRGFLRGSEALYVVQENRKNLAGSGIIMIAHIGCGVRTKRLSDMLNATTKMINGWTRCFVDGCCLIHEARICAPDSQSSDSFPLSTTFSDTTITDSAGNNQIPLLPTCCGSLCKYLMVTSGRAAVYIHRAKVQTSFKIWDHAVGIICVLEAGGKVTDWKGSQVDLAADKDGQRIIYPSGGILVTNGNLHDQILDKISSVSSNV